ncbi:cyclopentanone monooxygenase [Colletotrichum godetiae]|uniref:Cyclopentanone monooxygenase n=1 Tax=Colletotrichum godetiae TaxID=1209918 RepID=A0AAJ0A7D2_9PEZI|nr:cyclopentanone monooxygenase [Colletotrichum godetiae]KAK1657891.1 cyclopentanone monooxygenase [Colletotrichum godetiae]
MTSPPLQSNETGRAKTLDVLIIGAGCGGCYSLYKLRKLGFNVHVYEAGSALGEVWHWNTYPRARVDSEMPFYQFSIPEVWRKWNWSERFPSGEELRGYFNHVEKTLDLSRNITYKAVVNRASYIEDSGEWTVTTENGHNAVCKYLVCATGSCFKPHYPNFRNLDEFKGQLIYSTRWPADAKVKDKRVAIIGSGATTVQCTQEVSKVAEHLTVYIRTASISLPMVQRPLSDLEQEISKSTYRRMFEYCRNSHSSLGYDMQPGSVLDLSDAEREELWEELWNRGCFNFKQSNYRDFLVDEKPNRLMYEFGARKTRPRVKNPAKAAFLVPEKASFAFGTKRSSLEQDYYEYLDRDTVSIVDLKANPIREFTDKGITCEDGSELEFDTIVMATGFDAMTGSLTKMNFQGRDGITFADRWKNGVPTAFSNGPPFIEVQVDMIAGLLQKLQNEGVKSIEAQRGAEEKWKQAIQDANDRTLMPLTDSWYNGANIPGKKREQLMYLVGVKKYQEECREALATLEGFNVVLNE